MGRRHAGRARLRMTERKEMRSWDGGAGKRPAKWLPNGASGQEIDKALIMCHLRTDSIGDDSGLAPKLKQRILLAIMSIQELYAKLKSYTSLSSKKKIVMLQPFRTSHPDLISLLRQESSPLKLHSKTGRELSRRSTRN